MSTIETGRPLTVATTFNKNVEEFEVELHYEQKLRSLFFESSDNDGLIRDEQGWDCLIAMYLKARVISIEDSRRLEKVRPSFPMSFDTLLNTITQAFGDQQLKDLNSMISENKEQLENVRTYINMMNVKQLSGKEMQ